MAIDKLTAQEAVAQGSSWKQMLSIADFHERAIKLIAVDEKALSRMPPHKAKVKKREVDEETKRHQESASHFRTVASDMRALQGDLA